MVSFAFPLFFIGVIVFYALLNYYVLHRQFAFFSLKENTNFWILLAAVTCSFIAATILEDVFSDAVTRSVYGFAGTIAGSMFIITCLLLLYEILHLFIKLKPIIWGEIILSVAIALIIISLIAGNTIITKNIQITDSRIPQEIKIAQIADMHLGPVHNDAYVERIIAKLEAAKPDIVVITGDLIDGRDQYKTETFQRFNKLAMPILFVTGNHEGFADPAAVDLIFANTTIQHIAGKNIDFKGIQIIGVDNSQDGAAVAAAVNSIQRDSSKYTLLLYHRPGASSKVTGVDLMLSSHTHNGQIFPFTLLTMLVEQPVTGLHKIGNMTIYVTPGTGTWGPPMRLGTVNEITIFTLKP